MSQRFGRIAVGLGVALLFVAGLAMRLEGIGSSLWVDEFGTLWVIESGLADVPKRCVQAQGQTPLYYVVTWGAMKAFGESEEALRAVSIVAAAIATILVGLAGARLGGARAGIAGALLLWFDPSFIATSTSVRPYALADMFAALSVLGFVQACTHTARAGRVAFVAGVAALWWTHFLLAPMAAGLMLAWLVMPALRTTYPPRSFVRDVALIGVLVAPTLPQLLGLAARRSGLAWAGFGYSWGILSPLLPFACVGIVGLLFAHGRRRWPSIRVGLASALVASVVVHIGVLAFATWLGAPLMVNRFLMVVLVPAAALAGSLIATAPTLVGVVACVIFLAFSASDLRHRHQVTGSFSRAGYQHWREAVETLDGQVRREPSAVVLYRSGFVEDDVPPFGNAAPHTRSPLRSPGRSAPRLNLVVLPFRWSNPALAEYLDGVVAPRLASSDVFYFIGPPFAEPAKGEYVDNLRRWVAERWPGTFRVEPVGSAQAMILLRFSRQ